MIFKLWSVVHFLYLLSPFIIFTGIYFLIKNRSERVKYIVGVVLGSLSILILLVRNIDIFIRQGWEVEVIPLQVCHIGSLVAGIALITRKRWLIITSFCFNMIPAFLAMVFADSLANYDTLLKIRAQAYVWGHILIVVCALYGILVLLPRLSKRDLAYALTFVGGMATTAVICNSAFRALLDWTPNYFYLYDYKGTPLKFLYKVFPTSSYGWFSINWFYVLTLLAVFVAVFIGLFYLAKFITEKMRKRSK